MDAVIENVNGKIQPYSVLKLYEITSAKSWNITDNEQELVSIGDRYG